MHKKLVLATIALTAVLSWAGSPPAVAQVKGCKEFGQNISYLTHLLGGRTFGSFASSGAPLNDTVVSDKTTFCP